MSLMETLAHFYQDDWEVHCSVTRLAPDGHLSGHAEISRGGHAKCTIGSLGVYKTREQLGDALTSDALKWIRAQHLLQRFRS